MSKRKSVQKTIAAVLYDGLTALHVVGAIHAMGGMARQGFRHIAVAASKEPVQTDTPLQFLPATTFDMLPSPSGLVIPGSGRANDMSLQNDELLEYVRQTASTVEFIVAVGTGTLILGAAGLLQGKQATTRWDRHRQLESYGARYVHKPWIQDGKLFTASGLTGSVDLGLFLTARYAGQTTAQTTQLFMEYSPEPPFGAIEWDRVAQSGPKVAGRG